MNAQPNPYEPPRTVSHLQRAAFLEAPIRVAGQLSWSEAIHAFGLAARRRRWIAEHNPPPPELHRRMVLWFLVLGLLAIASNRQGMIGYLSCSIGLLMAAVLIAAHLRIRRQWRKGTGPFAPFERIITQEGIEEKGSADGWRPWNAFTTFKRSDSCVLLYVSLTKTYLIFPRSLFPGEAEWHDFLQFLQAKLPEA